MSRTRPEAPKYGVTSQVRAHLNDTKSNSYGELLLLALRKTELKTWGEFAYFLERSVKLPKEQVTAFIRWLETNLRAAWAMELIDPDGTLGAFEVICRKVNGGYERRNDPRRVSAKHRLLRCRGYLKRLIANGQIRKPTLDAELNEEILVPEDRALVKRIIHEVGITPALKINGPALANKLTELGAPIQGDYQFSLLKIVETELVELAGPKPAHRPPVARPAAPKPAAVPVTPTSSLVIATPRPVKYVSRAVCVAHRAMELLLKILVEEYGWPVTDRLPNSLTGIVLEHAWPDALSTGPNQNMMMKKGLIGNLGSPRHRVFVFQVFDIDCEDNNHGWSNVDEMSEVQARKHLADLFRRTSRDAAIEDVISKKLPPIGEESLPKKPATTPAVKSAPVTVTQLLPPEVLEAKNKLLNESGRLVEAKRRRLEETRAQIPILEAELAAAEEHHRLMNIVSCALDIPDSSTLQ